MRWVAAVVFLAACVQPPGSPALAAAEAHPHAGDMPHDAHPCEALAPTTRQSMPPHWFMAWPEESQAFWISIHVEDPLTGRNSTQVRDWGSWDGWREVVYHHTERGGVFRISGYGLSFLVYERALTADEVEAGPLVPSDMRSALRLEGHWLGPQQAVVVDGEEHAIRHTGLSWHWGHPIRARDAATQNVSLEIRQLYHVPEADWMPGWAAQAIGTDFAACRGFRPEGDEPRVPLKEVHEPVLQACDGSLCWHMVIEYTPPDGRGGDVTDVTYQPFQGYVDVDAFTGAIVRYWAWTDF